MSSKIFVGDIGTAFRFTVKENDVAISIATATLMRLKFQPPDGVSFNRTGSFLTDGTDGIFQYLSQSGDLSVGGLWYVQGYLEMTGWSGHGDPVSFRVYETFT